MVLRQICSVIFGHKELFATAITPAVSSTIGYRCVVTDHSNEEVAGVVLDGITDGVGVLLQEIKRVTDEAGPVRFREFHIDYTQLLVPLSVRLERIYSQSACNPIYEQNSGLIKQSP